MRRSALMTLAPSVLAIALLATFTSPAAAVAPEPGLAPGHAGAGRAVPAGGTAIPCAKNDYPPNVDGITAQRFPTSPELNSFGAADFRLSRTCDVTSVTVSGIGDWEANRIVIWIYKNTARNLPSLPGTSKCSAVRSAPGPDFVVPVSDCRLKKGHYWLAVQVDTGATWFWATTDYRKGLKDAWRNSSDGWETSCMVWDTVDTCLEFPWDYLFSIRGPG